MTNHNYMHMICKSRSLYLHMSLVWFRVYLELVFGLFQSCLGFIWAWFVFFPESSCKGFFQQANCKIHSHNFSYFFFSSSHLHYHHLQHHSLHQHYLPNHLYHLHHLHVLQHQHLRHHLHQHHLPSAPSTCTSLTSTSCASSFKS